MVSVEFMDPPGPSVMFWGAIDTWNVEKVATDSCTVPEKPSTLAVVMVAVAEPPSGMTRKVWSAESLNVGPTMDT